MLDNRVGNRAAASLSKRPRSFPASVAAALRGLRLATRTQPNFRIQLLIAAATLVAAHSAGFGSIGLSVLAATMGFVLAAELLNTAIEMVTDLLHPEDGPQAAAIKDVSAAGVLVASLFAVGVGLFLFLPFQFAGVAVAHGVALLLAAGCLVVFVAGAVRSAR